MNNGPVGSKLSLVGWAITKALFGFGHASLLSVSLLHKFMIIFIILVQSFKTKTRIDISYMYTLTAISPAFLMPRKCRAAMHFTVSASDFPPFLPKEVQNIEDPFARKLATRIERLPVQVKFSNQEICIMSSCVKPQIQSQTSPVVLLHGFDSSCLEWRYTLPMLEESGLETWAIDILGWGFSDLEELPSCDVASKRNHLYQFWRSHIRRPVIMVGPSLGAAVAIDFAVNYPEAVDKLVLIDASVYAEGTGDLAKLQKPLAYAGVYLLKSVPLRLYANFLSFSGIALSTAIDWMKVGRLHCLYPWWEDATVNFMTSGGYSVISQIKKVEKRTLIIWGEDDQIVSNKLGVRLHCELPNATIRQIPDCGHIPHVEKPDSVSKLIMEFVGEDVYKEVQTAAL
ncbi:alpha/beta hydrolase domain-containing protein VTE7 [Mercurialis annua]|uniref:alpha/beta hydrolase domain-containing protein VTE7 n=1 Tax=Mercurialis annua TaxID=3986 RepID=UPI0024ACFF21|nr:alpha/beta hydrolase domain-containing protein VTE7 [Mercurialis annua]